MFRKLSLPQPLSRLTVLKQSKMQRHKLKHKSTLIVFVILLGLGWAGWRSLPAQANEPIAVNSQLDLPDQTPGNGICEVVAGNGICTLRAAIMEANALPGGDTIDLPPGTYFLTRMGIGDDTAQDGDLDVTQSLTINGAGAATTIIDGQFLEDRIFHFLGPITINLAGITLTHGQLDSAGGGIFNDGSHLTITGCVISHNTTNINYGGGMYTQNEGRVKLINSSIHSNFSLWGGGGIAKSNGSLEIINSVIMSNTVGSNGDGGGIVILSGNDTITVTHSLISRNRANRDGGGIRHSSGLLLLINSTISHNEAKRHGGGLSNGYEIRLYNVTITQNAANTALNLSGLGGGLYNPVGGNFFSLYNSLIANNRIANLINSISNDCYGSVNTASSYNLLRVNTNCTGLVQGVNGNQVGTAATPLNPELGPLQDNGGPTFTHALLANSPAIDQGDPSGCTDPLGASLTTDQRGSVRPVDGDGVNGSYCDIGAFEYSLSTPTPTPTPTATGTVTATPTPTATGSPTPPGSTNEQRVYLPIMLKL